MVKRTRRASKINKRRKTNTRSKRGRGRGHRTVKRGGMMKHAAHASRTAHAAHAARSAHAAAASRTAHKPSICERSHAHTHTPGYMPRPPFLEVVGQELNKKFEDPVEMGSSYMGAHDAATKAMYNEKIHDSFGTPVCQAKSAHFTPSAAGRESMYGYPPNYVYSTPYGASTDLQSPPPPTTDLFVRGTGIPVMYNNSVGFAPGAPGAPPAGLVRSLDAELDMLPAPIPPGPAAVFPVAPVDASPLSPQRSDFMSPNLPNTFPRANRNRMNCNKISGSP